MCFPLTIRLPCLLSVQRNGMAKRKGKGVQVPVPADHTPPKGTGPEETLRAALAEETEKRSMGKGRSMECRSKNPGKKKSKNRVQGQSAMDRGIFLWAGWRTSLPPPCESSVFPPKSPSTWPGQQPGVWPGYPSPLPGGDWVLPGYPLGGFGVPDMMWWMQFMSQLKGSGKGYSEPWKTESRDQGPEEQRGGVERSNKKKGWGARRLRRSIIEVMGKAKEIKKRSQNDHTSTTSGRRRPTWWCRRIIRRRLWRKLVRTYLRCFVDREHVWVEESGARKSQGNPRQTQSITGIGEDRKSSMAIARSIWSGRRRCRHRRSCTVWRRLSWACWCISPPRRMLAMSSTNSPSQSTPGPEVSESFGVFSMRPLGRQRMSGLRGQRLSLLRIEGCQDRA